MKELATLIIAAAMGFAVLMAIINSADEIKHRCDHEKLKPENVKLLNISTAPSIGHITTSGLGDDGNIYVYEDDYCKAWLKS